MHPARVAAGDWRGRRR